MDLKKIELPVGYLCGTGEVPAGGVTHMGDVTRLKIKRQPWREAALQSALDLGDWSEPMRLELNARLRAEHDRGSDEQSGRWAMVTADRAIVSDFVQAVVKGPRGLATFAVWQALGPFIKVDDGLLLCSQRTLAEVTGIAKPHVNFALKRLVEIEALQAVGNGRYRVSPVMLWSGAGRKEAVAKAPPLALGKKRGKLALVET